MHSRASDGDDTVQELFEHILEQGIRTFALTDHDTTAGCEAMEARVRAYDPDGRRLRFVRGIEFSCVTVAGKCHILGYGYDPEEPLFQKALQDGSDLRQAKLRGRIGFLRERFGIRFTEDQERELYGMHSPGKPNLARFMVANGDAESVASAIRDYIDRYEPPQDRIPAETAIRGILAAGGIPVWAHPLGGEGETHLAEDAFQHQLSVLMNLGIRGLECWYSRFSQSETAMLLEEAGRRNLLVSGGSDYHGAKTKNIPLGTLNAFHREVREEELTLLCHLSK